VTIGDKLYCCNFYVFVAKPHNNSNKIANGTLIAYKICLYHTNENSKEYNELLNSVENTELLNVRDAFFNSDFHRDIRQRRVSTLFNIDLITCS